MPFILLLTVALSFRWMRFRYSTVSQPAWPLLFETEPYLCKGREACLPIMEWDDKPLNQVSTMPKGILDELLVVLDYASVYPCNGKLPHALLPWGPPLRWWWQTSCHRPSSVWVPAPSPAQASSSFWGAWFPAHPMNPNLRQENGWHCPGLLRHHQRRRENGPITHPC